MTGREGVRPWHGTAAAANDLDAVRAWVVWGTGAPSHRAAVPEDAPPDAPTNDIARKIAETSDPGWGEDDEPVWLAVVEGDEDDIDAWMTDDQSVRGYAPYLIAEDAAVPSPEPMRGVLRNDVVRRRPFDAARANEGDEA